MHVSKSRRLYPLRFHVAGALIGVLLVTLVAVGAYTYFNALGITRRLAEEVQAQAAGQVRGQVMTLLRTAENQSDLLTGLARPSVGPNDRLRAVMVELVRANPEFSSVGVTWAADGSALQVRQETGGTDIVQRVAPGPGGFTSEESTVFGDELNPLRRGDPAADPRVFPSYELARRNERQSWTGIELRPTTTGPDVPVLTCATPAYDAAGRLRAVVTVDLALTNLGTFLQGISLGATGYAFMAELQADGPARVVAHPQATVVRVQDGGADRIATLAELGDRPAERLLQLARAASALPSDRNTPVSFRIDGVDYTGSYGRIGPEGFPRWVLFTLVPVEEFMGDIRGAGVVVVAVAGAALIGGALAGLLLAGRVAKPLQELSEETARIRDLDLADRPAPVTSVSEVHRLAGDMQSMKVGLRSFQKLAPREYVAWLIRTGNEAKLGGLRREITVSFADTVGFTRLTESVEPEQLLALLTRVLERVSREVLESGGTIDKFNGDDVMAFWNAPADDPDHALHACMAALAGKAAVESLAAELLAEHLPPLSVRFGIATGDLIVGNVGSEDRMNYTVIGDAANLASRLQGVNRAYRTSILVSPATVEAAGPRVLVRPVDWVRVWGREQPVLVHELMALSKQADPALLDLVREHTEGVRLYQQREWMAAADKFESVLRRRPGDGPASVLLDRCLSFGESEPLPDWDGSHTVGLH